MLATLARRERESPADAEMIAFIRERFRANWTHFAIVEVTQQLVELAGEYADTFALLGYDSVQLASAKIVQDDANQTSCFACFDTRLQKAATVLGMQAVDKQ